MSYDDHIIQWFANVSVFFRMNEEYGDIVLLKKMLVTDDTVYLYNPADFEKVTVSYY